MSDSPSQKSDSLRWWVLATVMIGTLLGRLDQTIVNLALPKIIGDFSITVSAAGWIATAYILANAVFVPIWGKLGDTKGRKKVYILGFSIFIFGSVLAGLAWNLSSMIIFRVIQAIASSADYPTAMAIIAVTFREGKERAQALGIWSASFAAGAVLGPLIGGPLIDNFGWRSIFLINLPVGLIGLIMALTFVEETVSDNKSSHFDWWGAITLGISLAALVLVLDKGADWGWLSLKSMASYLSVLASGAIFVLIENKTKEPIVDLNFFKNKIFINVLINNFVVFMGMISCVFLIPIFAQTFLGYNATQTGYLFMPLAFVMVISAAIGGRLAADIPPRYVIMGSTLVAAYGIYLFSALLDPRSGPFDIILPLCILALGMGFAMAHRTNLITVVVPKEEVGSASAVLALVRNVAGAFGIALGATVLNNAIKNNLISISRQSSFNSTNPFLYKEFISLSILKSQISAYRVVFLISAAIIFVGAITAWWLKISKEQLAEAEEVFVE